MSDSIATKRALAEAVKQLMKERRLSRITISDICDACGMNRKSFYYHFRDKYDLVNWIFSSEFMEKYSWNDGSTADAIERLCVFFSENRSFYRIALQERGQNSFYEYLGEVFKPIVVARLERRFGRDPHFDFFAETVVCTYRDAVVRWLEGGCRQSPHEFVQLLYRTATVMTDLAPRPEGPVRLHEVG